MICFRGLTVVLTASKPGKISQQFRAGIDLLSIDVQKKTHQNKGKSPLTDIYRLCFQYIHHMYIYIYLVGGLEHLFFGPYIGNNNPN